MVPVAWIRMPKVFKLLLVLFLVCFAEGKPKESKRVLPIEVVLSPPSSGQSVVKGQNKAIQLKIRSDDDSEAGKVDLIIAATKQVQTTGQTVDRYSPAYNAQLISEDIRSKLGNAWDNSLQDTNFYSNSGEVFPYMSLRQALRTPQPLLLGRSQFSPLQGMGRFENGLQTQMFMNPGLRTYDDLGVVMSQPMFTNSVTANQDGLLNSLNSAQLYGLQKRLLNQLQNQQQQLDSLRNAQPNGYTTPPPKKADDQGEGSRQNAGPTPHTHPINFQPYNEPARNQATQTPPQSIPEILGPNRQQLPLQNRPAYTLPRNFPTINAHAQRNQYQQQQQSAQHQNGDFHRNPPQANHALAGYHPAQNAQQLLLNQHVNHQQLPLNQHVHQQGLHLYQNPQMSVLQQRPLPNNNAALNDPQSQYRSHYADPTRLNSIQRHHPPLRELNSRPLILDQNIAVQQAAPQQTLANNFPTYQNGHLPNRAQDDRRYPAYQNGAEGQARNLPARNVQQALTNSHHRPSPGLIQQQSNLAPLHDDYASRPTRHQDTSYGDPHRRTEVKDSLEEKPRQKGNYEDSSTVRPKRRRKAKKRVQLKEKEEDLDGHSSHQYIIKIG